MISDKPVAFRDGSYPTGQYVRAIEDGFPFEAISDIAEGESWRKEIYRPIYHVHKWWAQRLGSVFRAAIIAAAVPKGVSVTELFYQPTRLPGLVVFDPFMGSGTTIGEAHKLGCTAVGRDINPVAYRSVRTVLSSIDRHELDDCFNTLCRTIAPKLSALYRGVDRYGKPCDVLYYFWVKNLPCPGCGGSVDLFPTFVFARHAYVTRSPGVHVVCPDCDAVFSSTYGAQEVTCAECGVRFHPAQGWARHTTAKCRHCGDEFPIARAARAAGRPPSHRMYAKLVLRSDGTKEYLRITSNDLAAFAAAQQELCTLDPPLPRVPIPEGYNTRQIINYGYRYWHELFNERQLLGLTCLAQAIRALPASAARDALAVLFSGALEFNNMFASYKGEGTGAVRHMFSHHILKPERMPIEANVWGTPKSSGAFSTLYRSRLLRALDYCEAPFELSIDHSNGQKSGRKVYGLSAPMGGSVLDSYPPNGLKPGAMYLSCGSSWKTDLPTGSVDLVITDPPFFDNVHYSELADFFHVWQSLYFSDSRFSASPTSRHTEEVQDVESGAFAEKLRRVFQECWRVLRDDGLLVFSYHHSREDGWLSIAQAVLGAGFSLVQSQPVKSEMSVAAPKSQAVEPIDLDVLMVSRKRQTDLRQRLATYEALRSADEHTHAKVDRFNRSGRKLSRSDVRVVLLSQLLVELSAGRTAEEIGMDLNQILGETRLLIENIWAQQTGKVSQTAPTDPMPAGGQPNLFTGNSRTISGSETKA